MIDALVLWTSGTLTTTCTWRMWEVVNKDTKCYRCGGCGHMAMHCATPKGGGDGKGSNLTKTGKATVSRVMVKA